MWDFLTDANKEIGDYFDEILDLIDPNPAEYDSIHRMKK